ncbi:aldose epimerase family protein [Alteromonadaceae bacterium BrNp21-10]|nr:aldose epimerase family protein [Alteromonadaceae bacterium BrNp21-10]
MKKFIKILGLLVVVHGMSGCENDATDVHASAAETKVSAVLWGEANNQPVYLYTLTNNAGMQVKVSNWGAYVQSILVADKLGKIEDVLVGYNSWQEYYNDCCYSGPVVGRFGNRIAGAQFEIDGQVYQVTKNDGGPNKDINQLHGGKLGLHKRLWQSKIISNGVELSYLSVDGEEGYPGNLNIKVRYTLNQQNEFAVAYAATTDKTTPVNLTLHTYFNLSGDRKRSIEGHELMIAANKITPVDDLLIPTGALQDVANTPFDFTQAKLVAKDIRVSDPQLLKGGGMDTEFGGFDHNWVFSDYDGSLKNQVSLYDPQSGRLLEILTQEPAIQFYSGNFMDGSVSGKNAKPILHREGLALEPQHFPDSPNQPQFPSTLLKPGDTYQTQSVYRFSVK